MNNEDIYELCKMFGVQRVKMELVLMHKQMNKEGFINLNGLELELKLNGRYNRDSSYKILERYIDDISSKNSTK